MLKDLDDDKLATLALQGIGAACALIGLLADSENLNPLEKNVDTAWKYGDEMAAEFILRAKAIEEKKEASDGGKTE